MFSRWSQARTILLHWLPWVGWALVFAVVLADLFVGRFQVIGPTVFGLACGVSGVGLGRFLMWGMSRQPLPPEPEDPAGSFFFLFFLSVGAWVVGVWSLVSPMGLPVPENASFAWRFPPGQRTVAPDNRHILVWQNVRYGQCFFAPIFLFIGGVTSAFSTCWFFYPRRPRSKPRTNQESLKSEARAGAAPGPSPFIVVVVLGLFLIFVLITLWQL